MAAPAFWPDIDVYFRQDIGLALEMVAALRGFGVQTIKTAALHDPDCCLPEAPPTQYFVPGRGMVTESYRRIVERHVVPLPQLRRLCQAVRDQGLALAISVYDDAGIALAVEFGASAVKIPSSNIVHAPLIRAAAASGTRLVLDTGRSQRAEVDRAVAWAREAGARDLLVQHSPPGPPAPDREARLALLPAFGARYGCAYGLSDHHPGIAMFPLAVALGASVIEKGVCSDGAAGDIDLAHALPLSGVPRALEAIRAAHEAIGDADLAQRAALARPADRMGLVAARDLQPGDVVSLQTMRFAFPTVGIPVEDWDVVAGRRLACPVPAGTPVQPDHLQAP